MRKLDYKGYLELISSLTQQNNKIAVYFEGTRDAEGKSWCPDCQAAQLVLEELIPKYHQFYDFYRVEVGTRREFRKLDEKFRPTNRFRTSHTARIKKIPTIIIYGRYELDRLVEKECQDKARLENLLKETKKNLF